MLDRRHFLTTCSRWGLGSTLFPGTLWALAHAGGKITPEMIDQASVIADVPIPPETRDAMLAALEQRVAGYEAVYRLHIANSTAPAIEFDPVLPGVRLPTATGVR